MAQPEARLSRRIQAAVKEQYGSGVFIFKVHGSAMMVAGLPDLVACLRGQFFALETKMPGKEANVSPRQEIVHRQLKKAGAIVAVVTSPDEALALLGEYIDRRDDARRALATRGKRAGIAQDDS